MDARTVEVYDERALDFAARHRAAEPTPLYRFILGFFHAGQPSADIGCGSGRDVAWLNEQGFPTIGYDASEKMLEEAGAAYPGLDFRQAALPDLAGIEDASIDNVLCSAVLMHLPREELITAVLALARILKSLGRLVLAVRESQFDTDREPDGRL